MPTLAGIAHSITADGTRRPQDSDSMERELTLEEVAERLRMAPLTLRRFLRMITFPRYVGVILYFLLQKIM